MTRSALGLALSLLLTVSACATAPDPTATTGPTPSPVAPGGSAAVEPTPTCPNYVEVVETGPLPPDAGEIGPVPVTQARLQHDVEAAIEYGAAHPDEFASVRFENAPRVRIVVGFTDHIDVHCEALRALFEYPDEFEIIRQPETAHDILRIQEEVAAMAGGKLVSAGSGAGTIDVTLRADGEAIADQIHAKYGDLVTIRVGLQAYPPDTGPAPDCTGMPGPLVMGLPLKASLQLGSPTVRSGEDFTATATVTNTSDAAVDFESGEPMMAYLYRPGTDQVVGAYVGGIGGVGAGQTLAPGESIDLDVVGGTASCLPDLGYALPPGQYDVRAAIDRYERPNGGFLVRYLLTAPATLTVTP